METTLPRSIPVARAAWPRLAEAALDAVSTLASGLRRLLQRWRAAGRRAAELRALRELSPSVLRDIGAAPEWIHEAQRRNQQHDLARDAFLRGL